MALFDLPETQIAQTWLVYGIQSITVYLTLPSNSASKVCKVYILSSFIYKNMLNRSISLSGLLWTLPWGEVSGSISHTLGTQLYTLLSFPSPDGWGAGLSRRNWCLQDSNICAICSNLASIRNPKFLKAGNIRHRFDLRFLVSETYSVVDFVEQIVFVQIFMTYLINKNCKTYNLGGRGFFF